MKTNPEYSSDEVINNLLDISKPFNPQFLYFFSDISLDDLEKIKSIWSEVNRDRKYNLLRDLESLMEANTLVSCNDFAYFALQDNNPHIRSQAIRLLWECSDIKLISILINLLQNDSDSEVNASAAAALGKFVLLGELEEIPEKSANMIQDLLIHEYLETEDDSTKQRILESLGYSSNENLNQFINNALKKDDKKWHLSALFAISRSANNIWGKVVVEKLTDLDPDIQIEAIKAAGELGIASAKEQIIEFMKSSTPDEELHMQAIWALSKIGGNDINELFEEMIEQSDDEEEIDLLEMAIDNLGLTDGMPSFGLFDQSR
jgi:hypothetical protein